ncbi:MAG: SDR family NAD(P)-dependent oxidoreductase [Culicoidibacterales bacterium]
MKNQTALITGATGGLGSEFCRIHAAKGFDLFLVSRSQGALEQLKKELITEYEITVHILAIDLSEEARITTKFLSMDTYGIMERNFLFFKQTVKVSRNELWMGKSEVIFTLVHMWQLYKNKINGQES